MNNNKLLMATAVATLSASFFSTSLFAANDDGTAQVLILQPLAITAGANMDFGDVAGDADETSTVTLTSGGVASPSAFATISGTNEAAGVFDVDGEIALSYGIKVPTAGILLSATGGSGGADMTVDSFTSSKASGTLDGSGSDSFTVGATLNLNAGQAADFYTGTYNVEVEYQ